MYCSSPGSSVHSISQARILEWVAISFFRGSPRPRDQTWVSCMAGDSLPTDPCMHVSREGVLVICYECLHESCARATCLHIMHHSGTCKSMLPLVFFRSQFDVSQFSSVQSLSCVWLSTIPWTAARQASLSITNSRSSLKFTSIESVMPSSHLILCRPLLLLPPILPRIRLFLNESTVHMTWPKYWSFSFNISPSNEHPGLISFRMDWLDLLAVQGCINCWINGRNSA